MSRLTGTGQLVRFILRRDRIYLPVWVMAILGVTYASAVAVKETYDTPAEITSYAANMGGSPATIAMNGPATALEEIGGILIYETSLTALIGIALMAIFLVVRHTRAEEEAGRTELVSSTVVTRHAAVAAVVLVATAAALLIGAGVALIMRNVAFPAEEATLYGASIAAMGLSFTGVAACAAQVMSHARGASGISLAVLGAAYALRAVGDVGTQALSFLSPMGWSQQVRVFEDNRWWPLAISVAFFAALAVGTVLLENRRDFGAGIVPERPGPAEGPPSLSTAVGLVWRLQRATVLAWAIGVGFMGLLLGSITRELENMIEDNPTFAEYFEQLGGASIVESYFATMLMLMGIGASGFSLSSTLRMRSEETAGRLEGVLATGVSRSTWLWSSLLVTLAGTLVVVVSAGLGSGLSYALVTREVAPLWELPGNILAYLPAILVMVALAVLLVGWLPRLSGLVWGLLAFCFVVAWLGGLLQLPGWVNDLSPFTHTPSVPADSLAPAPLLVMTALAALGVAAGLAGLRRRDIG